ncbi:hypothetical protein TRIATDRAFT_301171 [Trichoderma atroviride IMI 206040]|uniref:Secreted protein n=1 Tax=Hypocrea atroviridis (strain ATCC 20476 / IMI 206040) TaxID=452589 RepID=G9P1A5_HYPAI|nr:uncharacterized protein TRIATDRAFT_301171 [Trichoderma atroviride IMI 206040]EHK43293.1 hypothetical protein TRIATDRAFT_301171 [Trichoderma atroviride IMI 206040]
MSNFTWLLVTVASLQLSLARILLVLGEGSYCQHNVVSLRLPSRRFSLPGPWIWLSRLGPAIQKALVLCVATGNTRGQLHE